MPRIRPYKSVSRIAPDYAISTINPEEPGVFATELPEQWNLGNRPGGYLATNIGLRALFHVIQDIADHIRREDGTDLAHLSAEECSAEIKQYLAALVEFFDGALAHEIQTFRSLGSSLHAVRQQAWSLDEKIHAIVPAYRPQGLQEFLESRDEEGTKEARTELIQIETRLFEYIIPLLKGEHGTRNKEWWTKGIPKKIRSDCTKRWEEEDRRGTEEARLYLIHYIDICHHNWDLVKGVISLDTKDTGNKKACTRWIRKINDIRKVSLHPGHGTLSQDQVVFVRECLQKVEQFFPK